ncbi:hypothetical protein [Micromonospora chersina]|uniref:hypothetical protein n=1 Tax=Micromonospora chersina TaxID=47854 RepID=UPI00369AE8E4
MFGVAATIRALAVGSYAQFIHLNEIITAHQLRPVIDRMFPSEPIGTKAPYGVDDRAEDGPQVRQGCPGHPVFQLSTSTRG